MEIEGAIFDIDYINFSDRSMIRLSVKGRDGRYYELYDRDTCPYFYVVAPQKMEPEFLENVSSVENGRVIKALKVERAEKTLLGKPVNAFRVTVSNTAHVPKLSSAMSQYGTCYEYDIPFAKRYSIDRNIIPLVYYRMKTSESNGTLYLESIDYESRGELAGLNIMCFDIEVYNPLGVPRVGKDPIIMISYLVNRGKEEKRGVITFKDVDLPFVQKAENEKAMIKAFMDKVRELGIDIIVGYNSANFDIRYLLDRSRVLKVDFDISRVEGSTRIESHGLVDRVKIGGVMHIDMYVVVKFVSVVGASESILKLNSKTLKNVYEAITKDRKFAVEKADIYKLWDGGSEELKTLATYNMADADALYEVYDRLMPIMIELSRITYDMPSDVCVSTAGQLVEFMIMHDSAASGQLIPNKPSDIEMKERASNPIEGAYVKTPEPGIYSRLAVFDFRGLYPSLIISYNIDPSCICMDCKDYHESPDGTRFDKSRKGIIPILLQKMLNERASVKRAYKKDPDNIFLGARSSALKIVSNSFYGYLGYARSRWYSRPCAGSVTAYGRQYIRESIEKVEKFGARVIYGDTDSIVACMGDKSKEDMLEFLKDFNSKLPESMELELEDFYTNGVFVGKGQGAKGSAAGAKKKYALISESGRIKIRGFELVRRDWSKIARDTQRQVLETILKDGDAQKAAAIVKDVIKRLREGRVPLSELVINTQLRKSIEGYDIKSPELGAARKAIKEGLKTKEELQGAIIGYIITTHGSSISDKAELEEFAEDYDADYYINNQIIPPTMRILKELDFDEEELKGLGTQKKLM